MISIEAYRAAIGRHNRCKHIKGKHVPNTSYTSKVDPVIFIAIYWIYWKLFDLFDFDLMMTIISVPLMFMLLFVCVTVAYIMMSIVVCKSVDHIIKKFMQMYVRSIKEKKRKKNQKKETKHYLI